MKKFFLSALCLPLAFAAMAQVTSSGEGTEESPYLIKTIDDMNEFGKLVADGTTFEGKFVRLDADLTYGPTQEFVQVGKWVNMSTSPSFAGTFDGNGKKISGVTLSGASGMALFVATTDKATIKNLTVDNAHVTSTNSYGAIIVAHNKGLIDNCKVTDCTLSSTYGSYKGMIAGHANSSTIQNCSSSGILDTNGNAGGIAGQGNKDFQIINCTSSISVTDANAAQGSGNTAHVGGIMGSAPSGGVIKNCSFTGSISGGFNGRVGGIGGTIRADVSGCWSTGYVAGGSSSGLTGGLIASYTGGTISDCYVAGTVYNVQSANVGGLIGQVSATSSYPAKIEHCLVYGPIYVNNMLKSHLSELIGTGQDSQYLTLTETYYDKQMSGLGSKSDLGINTKEMLTGNALDGFNAETWTFTTNLLPRLSSSATNEEAILYAVPIFLGEGETANEVTTDVTLGTYTGVEWELSDCDYATLSGNVIKVTTPPSLTDLVLSAYMGDYERRVSLSLYPKIFEGEGTEASPFIIASLDDWKKLVDACNNQNMSFEGQYLSITADIDMQGVQVDPVGKASFAGTVDGNGHTFKNVAFTGEAGKLMNTGLFGTVTQAGTIRNINIAPTTYISASRNFGVLVYTLNGKVENCVNEASFTSKNGYCAGLVWSVAKTGTVTNCANFGNITVDSTVSTYGNCGGIAQSNAGTISNCVNAGNITANFANGTIVGGIAAANSGTITNVVNLGTITAGGLGGGISGTNTKDTSNALSIGVVNTATTYSTVGAISGTFGTSASATNAVFDSQIVVYNSIVTAANGYTTTKLTTAEGNPFAGIEGWTVTDGAYPMLTKFADNATVKFFATPVVLPVSENRVNITEGFTLPTADGITWKLGKESNTYSIADGKLVVASDPKPETNELIATQGTLTRVIPLITVGNPFKGDGTEESPYLISTVDDIKAIQNMIVATKENLSGKYFRLTADIDFKGIEFGGISTTDDEPFGGVFDGNGKTINNLTITSKNSNVGLFGAVGTTGVVKNLTLGDGCAISGAGNTGAFVGMLRGTVADCVNYATVNGENTYVGGIVGNADQDKVSILRCTNYGTVTNTKNYTGGIVGRFYAATSDANIPLTDCVNYGKISGVSYASGVVGYVRGALVSGCGNNGEVVGSQNYTAGVVATTGNNVEIVDCYNTGNVTGAADVAGILDYGNTKANLTRCYNSGTITGSGQYVAGLVVRSNTAAIAQCFNTGNVISTVATVSGTAAGAAGLVAYGNPVMTDCYNSGNVTAVDKVAGIISYRSSSTGACTLKNVYNTGLITATGSNAAKCGVIGAELSSKTTYTNVSYDSSLSGTLGAVSNAAKEGVEALTSAELVAKTMGEGWSALTNHYPVLTFAAETPAALVASAAILFAEGNSIDNVTDGFTVGCAGGVKWDGGDAFSIASDGKVTITATAAGRYPLTVSLDGITRTYELNVTATSAISDIIADGDDADAPVEYFNLHGIQVQNPAAGQVVIRRQGTKTTKVIVR